MAALQINEQRRKRILDRGLNDNLRREIDIRDKEVEALQREIEHHLYIQKIFNMIAVVALITGGVSSAISLTNMWVLNGLG